MVVLVQGAEVPHEPEGHKSQDHTMTPWCVCVHVCVHMCNGSTWKDQGTLRGMEL